jgi:hypothetical protein
MRDHLKALRFAVVAGWALFAAAAIDRATAQTYPGTLQPGQVLGNNGTAPAPAGAIGTRLALPAYNFYVNADSTTAHNCNGQTCSAGNDSNNCRSPSTACLTSQHVVNLIVSSVDLAGQVPTIIIADFKSTNYDFECQAPWVGGTTIAVQGNHTTPSNTVIRAPTGGNAIIIQDQCIVELIDVHLADSTTNDGGTQITLPHGQGHVDLFDVTFEGSTSGGALSGAEYTYAAIGNGSNACQVTGSYNFFLNFNANAVVSLGQCNGSPGLTFNSGFAILQQGVIIDGASGLSSGTPSFTGFSGITGPRCIVSGNFDVTGLNPNSVFPGSVDCIPTKGVGAVGVPSGSGASSTYSFGSAGQLFASQGGGGGNPDVWASVGGDCTSSFSTTINFTCTKTNGTAFGALATLTPGTGVATALGNNTNASGGVPTVPVANAALANASVTVNGTTCTLGSTCAPPGSEQGMTLLNVITITSGDASESDTTSLTSAYNDYLIVLDNIVPATNAVGLELQVQSGGSFQTSSYINAAGGATAYLDLTSATNTIGNTAGIGLSATLYLHNVNSTTVNKFLDGSRVIWYTGSALSGANVSGFWNGGQGALTGLKWLPTTGNFSSGTIRIYGLRGAL